MSQEENRVEGKKPYEAPKLATISLRPEEAVLSHCKTFTTGTFAGFECHAFGQCKSLGS
jgi:hypothetical protein